MSTIDDDPRPSTPWQQLVSVLVLLWLFDFVLGLRAELRDGERDASPLEILEAVEAAAAADHRTILVIGDAQRLAGPLRRELSRESDARIEQVAVDGLLPIDALLLVAELDRRDPAGEIELLVELDLGDFAAQYADRRDCTQPSVCALADWSGDPRAPALAWAGIRSSLRHLRAELRARAPVHRRRDRVDVGTLERVPGLVVARDALDERAPNTARERYRSAAIDAAGDHAQVAALVALLDRAVARGRKVSLFLTPLRDGFARETFAPGELGRRYAEVAGLVHDYDDPKLALLDVDHPALVDAHFVDHVRLGDEGTRLLARNLLHQLNLPLARRPVEQQMAYPEGHDRTLVHRVGQGYADGGAWQALFDRPEGVAVARDGSRIVIADTHNHVLRELRGTMQIVETAAGQPEQPGRVDGPASDAALDHPRGVELLDYAVWFIDGEQRDAIRVLERGFVRTPSLRGPTCSSYRSIRARPAAAEHGDELWALCGDGQLIRVDLDSASAEIASDVAMSRPIAFDLSATDLYLADVDGRLWRRSITYVHAHAELGGWTNLFANTGTELLPHGHRVGYPYAHDALRLAKVVDLRFIERYGGLLVADEFPVERPSVRAPTERVHLRYFDLDAERILPWIKATAHGEAHALFNESADQFVSPWHLGAMAIAQDDASLVWIEHERSRLVRVADGLLGVAKAGNHHTRMITIPMLQTLAGVARTVESQLRPDRYLSSRHEPLPRRGPYVGLLLGSSLSSMSDRFSNYSLGRRLELELQRELGYRDLIRFDLFQVSSPAASFGRSVNNLDNWMESSVPPDVVFIEAHDFGGGKHYLRSTKTRAELVASFARLRRLAERYDTLVVIYDLSSLEANRRESMRSTDKQTRELLGEARRLGFVVLDPGDRLFRELLVHSPWGNQSFGDNQHHGATWAVDRSAQILAAMIYPKLREFFGARVPARERERPPASFASQARRDPLGPALAVVELDRHELATIDPAFVQTELVDGQLRVYVDLAGFADGSSANLDTLAVAVIDKVLREDAYADFAETLRLEMVEFANYDEYGNGVLESARSRWRRELDRASLEQFLREHGPSAGFAR